MPGTPKNTIPATAQMIAAMAVRLNFGFPPGVASPPCPGAVGGIRKTGRGGGSGVAELIWSLVMTNAALAGSGGRPLTLRFAGAHS
jgi:hypothetical protein